MARSAAMKRLLCLSLLLASCGGSSPPPQTVSSEATPQEDADAFLAFYTPILLGLYTESARASWVASTDVTEEHTGMRTGADTALSAFTGNAEVIRRARQLLEHESELDDITVRQLREVLDMAASAPMTNPELARARVAAESAQSARLDGWQFCMRRDGEECAEPVTANDIDRVLVESRDLDDRLQAWNAAKEVGPSLRDGLIELQRLRNGVAQEMGHDDFFSFQVSNYGMSTDEMMELLDRLITEMRPLFEQVHCWARHELAQRYGVDEVPRLIPAHWLSNRWGQSWPGFVDGVNMDELMEGREAEWLVQQAERFYVSMGFPELPESFYTESDLYPVPEGETRRKNSHASAWHMDLRQDVRSLMSVEPTWDWFTTTHHELGHIYYYITYTHDGVPPLLRGGANRSYHEGMGDLIGLAASQPSYLREIGLMEEDQEIDEIRYLLDSALTGPVVFLPWSAGVMSHFERDLYAGELPADQLNARWWEHVARYQGIAPPADRPADGCDACTKTHINDDPGQYYDYALANVLVYQLHDHICRNIVEADPHDCNYYNRQDVGELIQAIMRPGATRDWREVLREHTGRDLTAEPMLQYYEPLMAYLSEQNQGRDCSWPGDE